ncbi:MAG: hypothetical protein ACRD3H_06910, partial [Terriglobales bacterium]
ARASSLVLNHATASENDGKEKGLHERDARACGLVQAGLDDGQLTPTSLGDGVFFALGAEDAVH